MKAVQLSGWNSKRWHGVGHCALHGISVQSLVDSRMIAVHCSCSVVLTDDGTDENTVE